jgi:hypothetical protein
MGADGGSQSAITSAARRRKRLSHLRVVRERPVAANQTWAVDFVHDNPLQPFELSAICGAATRSVLDGITPAAEAIACRGFAVAAA